MLFSILIPTYNNEEIIANAIASALNQDYDSDYEVIVSNNASTDRTLEVINSFKDKRLRIYSTTQTVDSYANSNHLLSYAKGDYVVFIHSDDKLLPNALTLLSKRIEERGYPKKFILTGRTMYGDAAFNAKRNGVEMPINTVFSGVLAKYIFLHTAFSPSGVCYSRESMLQLGGFPVVDGTYEGDWLSELVAAFDGWEFEVMDRMFFLRTYASTMSKIKGKENAIQVANAARWFYSRCTPAEQQEIESYWSADYLPLFDAVFQSKEQRLRVQMMKYKRNPWRIRKLVKWILIKCNIM